MRFRVPFLIVPMWYCVMHVAYADVPASGVPLAVEETPAEIEADHLVGQKDRQLEATGNATLRKDGKMIRADKILYTPNDREADAQGEVVLTQPPGDTVSGPHLHMNLETERGTMEQPRFQFEGNYGRATAAVMDIHDQRHYTLNDATYTTCPAGKDDWQLNMGELQLDRIEQVGTASHASVEFKGVPFVYTPWIDFPLDDHRKSGFLAPTYGSTSKGGIDFTLPYYWNIAPNADATFAPREMLKRGMQFNNEFRYLGAGYSSELHADILPNDQLSGRNRERIAVKHSQTLYPGVSGYVNFNGVSDDAYFRDLGTGVNSSAQVNLLQETGMLMNANNWNSAVRVQHYQTLQDPLAPITPPYARMPQITTRTAQTIDDAKLSFVADYTDFSHPSLVNGTRLVLNPGISYPLVSAPAFYVTPKLSLHSTQYVLGANNAAATPNATRTLPIFSVDSGIFLERETQFFNKDYLQTLEPRAFYVYVPYRKQDALPNFDSALTDFNLTQIFTENRFAGNDRIGDANQITLATTSRILRQDNGAEQLRMTLGERFSFITPQVNLVTPTTAATTRSDILLAVGGNMNKKLALDSLIDYNPNQSQAQQYSWVARYRPEPGQAFNFGYRFQRNLMRQTDISGQWPLAQHWSTVARMNYSFQDKRVLDSIAGVEYNESCWTVRFIAQHYTTSTLQTNTGFFVQLELNNFMQVGSDPLSVLKLNVPGYTKTNTLPGSSTAQPTP